MRGSRAYYLCDFFFIFPFLFGPFSCGPPPELCFGGYFFAACTYYQKVTDDSIGKS